MKCDEGLPVWSRGNGSSLFRNIFGMFILPAIIPIIDCAFMGGYTKDFQKFYAKVKKIASEKSRFVNIYGKITKT